MIKWQTAKGGELLNRIEALINAHRDSKVPHDAITITAGLALFVFYAYNEGNGTDPEKIHEIVDRVIYGGFAGLVARAPAKGET